jgi:hypothetical protein
MSKGKGKAVSGGAGGGPSTKAAAAAGSSGQGSSSQGSSRLSASPAQPIGFRTEEAAVQEAAPPLAAMAAGDTQQTEPQPAGGGNTKKDKERQRKERQRQRKIEEAKEALQGAIEAMDETAGGVEAVEEAMLDAAKHEARSESLAALVAEAKGIVEQARAAEAVRARVAAEATAAAVAVKAAEAAAVVKAAAEAEAAAKRQQMVAELAALDLRTKQLHSELGSGSGTSQLDAEETQCVVCFDAPKDHLVLPCKHLCVCEACAEQLTKTRTPTCPVCREPIQQTMKVFCT